MNVYFCLSLVLLTNDLFYLFMFNCKNGVLNRYMTTG
jgi:hypothetical protein